jgi:predicted nucleic acid-binding protein
MSTALLDTSVLIDLAEPMVLAALPSDVAVSAISLAELAAGPSLATDALERARRVARVQQVEALFAPIAFDRGAARSYGIVIAAVARSGRTHRSRVADLLIAATAHSRGFDLCTRNASDFAGLRRLISILVV